MLCKFSSGLDRRKEIPATVTQLCDPDHIQANCSGLDWIHPCGVQGGQGVKNSRHSTAAQNGVHLLRVHKQHLGLYARVASELGVSPSYVSLVANGIRRSEKIRRVLIEEIAKIHDNGR